MDEAKLIRTILRLLQLLVEARYVELANLTQSGSLTSQQTREAVETWPYPLVTPSSSSLADLIYDEAVEVADVSPAKWSIYINLWTKEEGRSDLTLEVTVCDNSSEYYDVRIENIHVL